MATSSSAYETFLAYARLAGFDDEQMIKDVYSAAGNYIAEGLPAGDILDLMVVSDSAPQSYKDYMSNFISIRQNATGITTVAEFNTARKQYRSLLSQFGLKDLATNASADKFLMNSVSPQEAADRLSTAYNAVTNADPALKRQLKTYFPSLSTADLVANILGVGQTVSELQKKINISGVKAEAATAGLRGSLAAEDLVSQGLTREQARQGYQNVAAQLTGATGAAARAGESTAGIQKSLEQENLLGMKSQRRAKLAIREQGLISGQSGTGTTSLNKQASGAF